MGGDGSGKGGLSSEKLKELLKGMGKIPGGGSAPPVPAPPASAP